MKSLVKRLLAKSAKAILKKYKPRVIAVTGSVGKTSTKEAIFSVVSEKFKTRTNIKNYNNEFGLPLTIIGAQSPKQSVLGWVGVFWQAYRMLNNRFDYPQVLVLELGIDKPGDMDYLMEIVQPDIAFLTTIGISHLQFFSNEQQILNEKKKIFKYFDATKTAILNIDDAKVASILPELSANLLTYGFAGTANLRIENYQMDFAHNGGSAKQLGTKAEISVQGKDLKIFLPDVLGQAHVYAATAAMAAGLGMNMKVEDILKGLKNYKAQPGRMRLIKGVHNSTIIDDTYNAAPFSTNAALKELGAFPAPKKIAVLGDMLELGSMSDISHKDIAAEVQKYAIDYFVAVGPQMKIAAEELKRSHFNAQHIFWFEKSTEAQQKVHELVTANCVVLVKGSQGTRMEKVLKQIMAEPRQADNLLCRQDPDWLLK